VPCHICAPAQAAAAESLQATCRLLLAARVRTHAQTRRLCSSQTLCAGKGTKLVCSACAIEEIPEAQNKLARVTCDQQCGCSSSSETRAFAAKRALASRFPQDWPGPSEKPDSRHLLGVVSVPGAGCAVASTMTASEPLGARLRGALDACPFLRAVAEEQGAFCAARVACCARGAGPVLQEQDDDCLAATWRLFHSAGGVVPLRTPGSPACQPDAASAPSVCPVTGRRAACPRQDAGEPTSVGDCAVAPHPRSTLPALQAAQAPLASISIPLLGLLVRLTPGATLGPPAMLCVHLLTSARVSHTRVSRTPD
jgi:hypothetical protein